MAARGQQAMPVVGFLDSATAADSSYRVLAFRQGLSEDGFFEGRNVAIEYRGAEDHSDRLAALAADLVARRVAVIVVTNPTMSAMSATSQIPIVFITGA